jgi:hypothetical protein
MISCMPENLEIQRSTKVIEHGLAWLQKWCGYLTCLDAALGPGFLHGWEGTQLHEGGSKTKVPTSRGSFIQAMKPQPMFQMAPSPPTKKTYAASRKSQRSEVGVGPAPSKAGALAQETVHEE